ncbi:hypothetical protein AGMMS49592_0520 [Endomicrobiia bacterium]|nr:hypothetical protein AGMMS49592_0520 [Endomicrobiia bacterium]
MFKIMMLVNTAKSTTSTKASLLKVIRAIGFSVTITRGVFILSNKCKGREKIKRALVDLEKTFKVFKDEGCVDYKLFIVKQID